MGEKIMIKNIIIIALVIYVITKLGMSMEDILNYLQSTLDKLQELLYYMKERI
jgi:uncharacterized protein YoxC